MPANADEILGEAKDAIEWLRWHSASSPTARSTWITMSRLLILAAKKVGGNTADIITAHTSEGSGGNTAQQQQPAQGTQARNPFEVYDGGEDEYREEMTERSDLDQFGFLREEGGMGSFFPTASEIERLGQGERGDDMQMGGFE